MPASEALRFWARGHIGNDAYPVRVPPVDPVAVLEKYDGTFVALYEFRDWQPSLMETYDRIMTQGGERAPTDPGRTGQLRRPEARSRSGRRGRP